MPWDLLTESFAQSPDRCIRLISYPAPSRQSADGILQLFILQPKGMEIRYLPIFGEVHETDVRTLDQI